MSLIEEVKLNLTRVFGDNSNVYAIDFLHSVVASSWSFSSKRDYDYPPIRIAEHDLLMLIKVRKSEETGKYYRQVSFQEISKDGISGAYYDIVPGELRIKGKVIKTDLINDTIRISLNSLSYNLSPDYELFYDDSVVIGSNTFDIVKGKRIKQGDFEQLDSLQMQRPLVMKDMDKLRRDIEFISYHYPKFKEAAKACNLIETLNKEAYVSIIVLKQFVEFKSLEHILNHPKLSIKYYDYIQSTYRCSSLGSGQCTGLKKGKNAYEVLGIPEFLISYIDSKMNLEWRYLIEHINFINRYLRFDKKANAADVEWVDKMCDLGSRSERFMIGYSYLLDIGYTREELNRYLAKIWDKQAVRPDDSIRYLYNILSSIEVMSNCRTKFFPKHLRITFDVESRRFKNFEKESNKKWTRDIIKSFVGDFDSYSITNKNVDGSPIEFCDTSRFQYLHYKRKDGTIMGGIFIMGNTVTEISSIAQSFTPKDKENIRKWAEEHHLFYAADNILNNWREY